MARTEKGTIAADICIEGELNDEYTGIYIKLYMSF